MTKIADKTRKLRVWLIAEGEPVPCDNNPRLMRMGILADYLARRGHSVVWWTSTFVHGKKEYLFNHEDRIEFIPNEELIFLHSFIGYKKNISISRYIYIGIVAHEFKKKCKYEEKPDVILCSWPTQEFAKYALAYGEKYHVPVILDARDEWPDIFTRAFPTWLSGIANIMLLPLKMQASKLFSKADVITSVQPAMLQWALDKTKGRDKNSLDQYIYIGMNKGIVYSEIEKKDAVEFWKKLGVTEDTWNICFYSGFSKSSADYYTVINAVKKINAFYPQIRLILCGKGDAFEDVQHASLDSDFIVLPGWCNDIQIRVLMSISKIGLYPMRNLPDYKDAIGNKFVGYLCEGLPILTSLQGYPKEYIEKYGVGKVYKENDVVSCYDAIYYLIEHEEERKKISINAKKRFEIDFDSNIVNKRFEELMIKAVTNYEKG